MVERDIYERTYRFSLRIIKLCQALSKDPIGKIVMAQVLRSGTSIGANTEEARAGQSRKDFLAKLSIARKEARETLYWLRLVGDSSILSAKRMNEIVDECDQILRVLSSIIIATRKNADQDCPVP
jgi:four helix bundle protein